MTDADTEDANARGYRRGQPGRRPAERAAPGDSRRAHLPAHLRGAKPRLVHQLCSLSTQGWFWGPWLPSTSGLPGALTKHVPEPRARPKVRQRAV